MLVHHHTQTKMFWTIPSWLGGACDPAPGWRPDSSLNNAAAPNHSQSWLSAAYGGGAYAHLTSKSLCVNKIPQMTLLQSSCRKGALETEQQSP